MALQSAPTPPVAASSPVTPPGGSAPDDAGDFAGALDDAASDKPAAALGSPMRGLGQRARKAPGDASSGDSDEAGTKKDRASGAAEPQIVVAAAMPLDIALLAQMAAAMFAPPTPRSTAAGAPSSDASAAPGQAGEAAPGLSLAGLLQGAGTGSQGSAGLATRPAAGSATAPQGAALQSLTGDGRQAGTTAPPDTETPALALLQGTTPSEVAPSSPASQPKAGSVPVAQAPKASRDKPATSPVSSQPTAITGAVARDGDDRPGQDRNVGLRRGLAVAGVASPLGSLDPGSATPPSPAQQVVTALQSLVARPSEATSQASETPSVPTLPAIVSNQGGLKTVTIQLNPDHLGPVSVTLRLRADSVDIRIAVSNPEALHLLDRDRHALAAAVEALGGRDTSLHLDPAAASSEGGPAGNAFTGSDGSSRQQQSSSDAASTGRGNQNRSAPPFDSQNDADDPKTSAPPIASPRRRDGSLYL